ncbi:MAG: hypothetical protein LBE18_09820 [Planctomycetaceae bacterium]|nr:hypothetical protein [Planctomycetaceae bacterium]
MLRNILIMYAYYTLSAITIIYLIFIVSALNYGKWYYLFVHPFALFCFEFTIKYRYASDIPGLTTLIDMMIGFGVVIISLMFWIGYCLVKKEYIESIKSFFFLRAKDKDKNKNKDNNNNDNESGISNFSFCNYIVFIIVTIILYYTCQYMKYGEFDLMFLQCYHACDRINTIDIHTSLAMRIVNRIVSSCFLILPFISLLLLFETFRKNGKQYQGYTIIVTLIISIAVTTGFFLASGFRTYVVSCFIIIITLTLVALLRPHHKVRTICFPIIIFMLIYCMIFFVTLRSVRWHGIEALYSRTYNILANYNSIRQSVNDNFFIQTEYEQIEYESNQIAFKNIDLFNSYIDSDEHFHNEINQEKTQELKYLKSLPIYGHAASKEIAWIAAYFGRHEKYMGLTAGFRAFFNEILPPPLGREHSFVSPVKRLEELKRGNAEGAFADGYISYGLLGGYLYWGIWAFICGLFAKFAVVDLFMSKPCLESNSLSIFLIVHISTILCTSRCFLSFMLIGFAILWISVAVIQRFYNFCNISAE